MTTMAAKPDTFVTYWSEDDIPGGPSRAILVLTSQTAVVGAPGGPRVIAVPGSHRVRSAWDAFLGRDVPPVWLLPQGDRTLHPRLSGLLSYDNILMEADFLMQIRITDPLRFWQEMVAGRQSLSTQDVAAVIQRELQPILSGSTRHFMAQGLVHGTSEIQTIQRELAGALRSLCAGAGMELLGVTHLGFRQQGDAVVMAEKAQEIQRRLEELELQSKIDRLESEQVWRQAQADWDETLTGADQAEIDDRAATGEGSAAFEQVVSDKLDRMQETLEGYMAAMSGSPAVAASTSSIYDQVTDDRLSKWIAMLRITGAGISLAVTLAAIYFPSAIPDRRGPEILAASLGFMAAAAAFISAWFLHRHLRQRRIDAARGRVQTQEQAERAARIAQEQGIRRYLEQRLRQASANCQQAWQRVYQYDIDVATDLRQHCDGAFNTLADKVFAADFPTSRYFARTEPSLEDLSQMVVLSQALLDQSQKLVDLSQEAYNAAVDGDVAAVKQLCDRLDKGRLALDNQFSQREQFLMR